MKLFKMSDQPIPQEDIVELLGALRQNALVESSHFAVAAVIELKLREGGYAYVSGVNVENSEHNRLSLHGEQCAIASAQSLFGGNIKFSRLWVMGAPDTIHKGSEHPLANNFVRPCGHCRQILLSFSTPESRIFSVTVNGKVGEPDDLSNILPKAFSERDLEVPTAEVQSAAVTTGAPWRYVEHKSDLSDANIRYICGATSAHIVDSKFCTSQITGCMIKVEGIDLQHYFSGVLIQDVAFLTTDAVFASVGQAVTELGGKALQFKEVHLYGSSLDQTQLSGDELQHLARFSTLETRLKFHTNEKSSPAYTWADCLEAFNHKLLSGMQNKPLLVNNDH